MKLHNASAYSLSSLARSILPAFITVLALGAGGRVNAQLSPICCEDFTGAVAGQPDREVNVLDLLAMLSQWGQTPSTHPGPDIAPLSADGCPSGGDGITDVGDLLALLAAWGPCDSKIDQCAKVLDPANSYARISADGTYPFRINGLLDGPVRPPTNDVCEVTTCNSTICGWWNYGYEGIPGGFQFGGMFGIDMSTDPFTEGGDVWFHYTAPGNGSAFFETVSNCGPGELTDTIIDIYTTDVCPPPDWGACGPPPEFNRCDDHSAPDSCSNSLSRVRIDVLQGETYLIRIGGFFAQRGDGALKTTFLDNSIFENALPIEIDTELTGTTVNAQQPVALDCSGVDVTAPGRWYRFEGNGHTVRVSTTCFEPDRCFSDDLFLFDVRLSIYTSTDGTAAGLTCVAAVNDDICNLSESITWEAEEGETYYILVHGTPDLLPPFISQGPYILNLWAVP